MGVQESFDHVLTSLYQSVLDEAVWPVTVARMQEVCGTTGSGLAVGAGFDNDVTTFFAGLYRRGERRQDLERMYFELFYPWDECVPRIRRLPDSRLVPVTDLYTGDESKSSPSFNEALPRLGARNGLIVRLDGPKDSRIVWSLADPIEPGGWRSAHIELIERLLPHIRQFVRLRQALVGADALGASLSELLDNARIGVIHLDRRGCMVEANDHARDLLRQRDGLFNLDGFLGTWLPDDNAELTRLLRSALPAFGDQAPAGGSMVVRRSPGSPHLTLHITPVSTPGTDLGLRRVAALVLLVDPGSRPRVEAGLVATTLGLSPSQSEVAALLAAGRTVRDIATLTGRQENAVYKHLKQTYRKLGISRQAQLVRLVLSRAGYSGPRN